MNDINALSEEQLEEMLFSNQAPAPTEKIKEPESLVQATEELVMPEVIPVAQPTTVQPTAEKGGEDWEKRFKQFKPKADRTIHTLRRENAALNESIAQLMSEVKDLRTSLNAMSMGDQPVQLLTEEDRRLLGDDSADSIEKGVQTYVDNVVSPLKDKLVKNEENEINKKKIKAKEMKDLDRASFDSEVAIYCPDFSSIDTDANFHTWLNEVDASGFPRWDLFRLASQDRDAERVAKFFNDYKYSQGNSLEQHLTPTSIGSDIPTSSNEPEWKQQFHSNPSRFIEMFYEEWTNGSDFKGKKGQALAQEIDDYITLATVGG